MSTKPTPEDYARQREEARRKRENEAFLRRVRGSCGGGNTQRSSYSSFDCGDDDDDDDDD